MFVRRYVSGAILVGLVSLAACGDPLEPVLIPVPDEPRTVDLVPFSGGALTESSAFDVITATGVRTDQLGGWDFVFDVLPAGTATLWPRGSVVSDEDPMDAGLRVLDVEFDAVREAPESGYTKIDPVPISVGDVIAVQSRRDPSYGSIRCRRYGKIEIMALDTSAGTLTFRHLVNPNCEKRNLVPGAEE